MNKRIATDSSVNYTASVFTSPVFGSLSVLVDKNGTPWFRAPDLIKMLDMDTSNVRRLSEKDRRIIKEDGHRGFGTTFISEPGMNHLIFASRKKEAVEIKDWLAREVMPSIRKNGGYILGQEELPEAEKEALIREVKALREQVANLIAEKEKALAGKAKMQELLIQEEDRCFEKAQDNRKLQAENSYLRGFITETLTKMGDVSFVADFLEKLRNMRVFEARKDEFLAADAEEAEKLARIPYVNPREPDADPLVRDNFGNVCRRSELLAIDRA